MSHSSYAVGSALCAAVFGVALTTAATANENPAHALAEKFSAASQEKTTKQETAKDDAAQRKADEADLLQRARKEAQDLRRANEQSLAAARKKEAERRAAAEKEAAEERARIARSEADRKRLDAKIKALDEAARAEKERLAQAEKARKAEAEKQRLVKAQAERAAAAEKARLAKLAKERAAQKAAQRAAKQTAEKDALAALTAERERTAKELEAKLRKIAATRKANGNAEAPFEQPPMALGASEKKPSSDEPSNDAQSRDTHLADAPAVKPRSKRLAAGNRASETDRVTILVEMVESGLTPSVPNRKKPDPVICTDVFCWISKGSDKVARKTTRRAALGPINTISRRAMACNRSLTCIYRGVKLPNNKLTLQAIDIGVLGHDRGQIIEVSPDFSCDSDYGSLKCDVTYSGDIWRAWIVPEDVAEKAGPEALRRALRDGLTSMREASLQ